MNLESSVLQKSIYYKKILESLYTISGYHLVLNYNEIPLEIYIKCRTSTLIPGEFGKIDVSAMTTR